MVIRIGFLGPKSLDGFGKSLGVRIGAGDEFDVGQSCEWNIHRMAVIPRPVAPIIPTRYWRAGFIGLGPFGVGSFGVGSFGLGSLAGVPMAKRVSERLASSPVATRLDWNPRRVKRLVMVGSSFYSFSVEDRFHRFWWASVLGSRISKRPDVRGGRWLSPGWLERGFPIR